ncbi:MAG: helix-hairpin-helix domain-containing protein [Scytolyngbya sp. HA4215-MV1]|nr:helix-hairpin-helix domain-containing protein [Scytolyngbya sp. HA4215-MV1]
MLGEDKYQAILNTQVLDAAKQAKQDFVWCIVVDQEMQAQVEVETGQVVKVDITTASEEELVSVLDFIRVSKTGFGKISPEKIAAAIVQYRQSNQITNLNFLTKAKCGVGKAKLPALAESLVTN